MCTLRNKKNFTYLYQMRLFTTLWLVLILISCSNKKHKALAIQEISQIKPVAEAESTFVDHECEFDLNSVTAFSRGYLPLKTIISQHAFVYCLPDTTSTILDTLAYGSSSGTFSYGFWYNGDSWVKLDQKGYVKQNIYAEKYLVTRDSEYGIVSVTTPLKYYKKQVILKKLHRKSNEIVQTLTLNNVHKNELVENVFNSALKNVLSFIQVSSELDECPGGETTHFVIDTKSGMKNILTLESEGFDGDEYYEYKEFIPYFPIKTHNKVVLAPYGKFEILSNDLSLNIHEPPQDIGFSIEELVVIKTFIRNNKNEEVKQMLTYYHWNGFDLKELN